MPELPEVESIKIQLERFLLGHTIAKVQVNHRKILTEGEDKLVGGKITAVRRFGKALAIDTNNGYSTVAHVKMTGQFIYRGPYLKAPPALPKKVAGGAPGKHTHVIFHLDKDGILYFNDYRRFGWIKVVKTSEVKSLPFIASLGPEPLDGLTHKHFSLLVSKTKRAIKLLLMDQTKIAGVGNIYANDALWLAKINPVRPAASLSPREIKALYSAIEKVLRQAIKNGGSSEIAFVNPDGTEGSYQNHFLVYDREGEPCPRCRKAKIKKLRLGSRGTYFCPKCQK